MYNLLVTYTKDAWEDGAYEYEIGRAIAGFGDANVSDRYKDFGPEAIAGLMSFPCLFVYEDGVSDEAYLGWITAIKPRDRKVRIEFDLLKNLPLSQAKILKKKVLLDIGHLSTTHWSVRDIDLIPALIKAAVVTEKKINDQGRNSRLVQQGLAKPVTELHIRPSVFRVPTVKVEDDLVSVMMPFAATFSNVFKAIKSVCAAQSLRCKRADNIWDNAEIIQDVFSLIYRSRIVICDFTGRNPNVLYEAGIAHTLGKTVIPIVQNVEDIPFDLRHIRLIKYVDNGEGRRALKNELTEKLERTISG